MNWRYNSAQSHRLFARRAAVILSLFISVMHVQAQTQETMNAQARGEFERADLERNKTYEALLTKLSDTESKQKLKENQRAKVMSAEVGSRLAGLVKCRIESPICIVTDNRKIIVASVDE